MRQQNAFVQTGWRRLAAALACGLLAQFAAMGVSAQTSDGIGGRTESVTAGQTAEEAAGDIDDLIDLYDYEERFYQISARVWAIHVPRFILKGPFTLNENTWSGGVTNFAYGLQFTTRIPDKFDVVAGLDYTNLRTPDGFWLEDGDPVRDADYTENNLSLINADVSLLWYKSFNRADTFQFYGGFGLGMGIVLGKFLKYDIDSQRCGWDTPELRSRTDGELVEQCADEFDSPRSPRLEEEDRIPPVLPAVTLLGGFRFLAADHVSIGIEGGIKTGYFFAGLNVGYFWNALR